MGRKTVIGQTGKIVLSDDAVHRKLSQKRTVRYQYQKVKEGFDAWVCGPFQSRLYSVCSYGPKKSLAKAALRRRLANDYGYIGRMMYSDVDEADTVGDVDLRLLDEHTAASPVMCAV